MATQTLVSELLVKLKQDVSGPAAEAKKALAGIESQLAAIGKQKAAEDRLIALAKRQEDLRERVRSFGQTMMESEKVTAAQAAQYRSLTSGLDKAVEAYRRQQQAVENGAQALDRAGVAARNYAEAEARLVAQAEGEVRAINQAVKEEERRQRLRESWLKESRRAIEEEARERVAAEEEALRATRTAEAERQRLARETAQEQARLDQEQDARQRRFRESWLKESQRAIEEEMRGRERAAKEAQRVESERQRQIAEARSRVTHGTGGFMGMILGMEVEHAGVKAVENAAELEQARFRIGEVSRNDPGEKSFADQLASDVAAKYPAISKTKALDTYIELRANAAGEHPGDPIDREKARRNLMVAARAQTAALANGFEMTAADMQNLLKGVEGSGRADDPKAVEKISDAYIRAKQVFGSAIASSMIRDYTANAKSSNFSVGDDQFYLTNMVRMSEGNASRLGNEVNQTLSTIVGGHMTVGAANWMAKLGLIKKDQIKKNGPNAVQIKGGVKDQATLETDQQAWATHTLREAIEKSGALSESKIKARADMLRAEALKADPKAQIDEKFLRHRAEEGLISAEIAKSGWRTSVTDNLAHAIGNERLIERDVAQLKGASGIDSADRLNDNPVAAFKEFTSSIQNFGAVLGSPIMKDAAHLLSGLASGIASVTQSLEAWQKANPEMAKIGAGVAGAGVIGGGFLASWYGLGALTSGFGLKGSAAALNESAAALNAAAGRLGAGNMPGAPGAKPNAPGFWTSLLPGLGIFGTLATAGYGINELREHVRKSDPELDRKIKENPLYGIGTEEQAIDPDASGTLAKQFREWWYGTKAKPDAASPSSPSSSGELSPLPPSTEHGEKAGTDLGNGIAQGLNKQSGAVQSEAERMYESLKALFMQPISVPIKIEAQGLQQAAASVRANVNNQMRTALHAAYTGHDWA